MNSKRVMCLIGVIVIGMSSFVGCGNSGLSRNETTETASLDEIERLPEDQKETELDKILTEHRKFRKESITEQNGSTTAMSYSKASIPGNAVNEPSFEGEDLEKMFGIVIDYLVEEKGFEEKEIGKKIDYSQCIDPRVNAIYDNEDKGVLNGYENENIFIVEYEDKDETYKFIFLARESKDSEWEVKHDGLGYKE